MRRHNASEMDCTLCRRLRGSLQSGVHDLRVVTRSYSLSQLSLLKTHETLVPSVGSFQSAASLIETIVVRLVEIATQTVYVGCAQPT